MTACPHRVELGVERRPGNALNIEIGAPMRRCRLRTPEHWNGADHRAVRWLASGGSALVLGNCDLSNCPLSTGKTPEGEKTMSIDDVASKKASGVNIPEARRGTIQLKLRLPPDVADDLDTLAERWGITRSGAVARLVEEASELPGDGGKGDG